MCAHDETTEQAILNVISDYCEAVHTQDEDSFKKLWSSLPNNTLISIRKPFEGTDAIVRDFLGLIRDSYTAIDLISDDIRIHLVNPSTAIALFRYHTVCVRRDDGSDYGIEGVETQLFVNESGSWKLHHVHYSS